MMKTIWKPGTALVQLGAMLIASVALCGAQSVAQPVPVENAVADTNPAVTDTNTKSAPQLQTRNPRYTIRSADTFDINFELSPEFNQSVTVQPDGFISLKSVGDVYVAGQTVPELTQTLRTSYGKILNDPLISVVLKDFEKPYFTASGQLNHPGKYELRGNVTLTEAIAMAGGFNGDAKHSQVLLFRRVNDQWLEAKMFNVKQMMKAGNLGEDPTLRPGDQLFVPKNALSKIKPFIPNSGVGAYGQIAP
jgi:polysaccharide biosynthesis/export protein